MSRSEKIQTQIVVLGAGLGKKVVLVELEKRLGGVCLNRGCIPSKAFLHATKMIKEAQYSTARGIEFSEPKIHLDKLRAWKESILEKLSQGIAGLAQRRGVQVMSGRGYFEDSSTLRVETQEGQRFVSFEKAIIAVGSRPALPAVFDLGNPRVMTSTEALEIEEIPNELLVVGGGYIGMELSTVYSALGSKVTVVEAMDSILMGADTDLIRPVMKFAESHFKELRFGAKVTKMSTSGKQIKVVMDYKGQKKEELYDRVLVSVGRSPNSADIGLENTKVQKDEKGFIKINTQQQTADPNIYAIGDIVGGLMLAHKASKEARVAIEAIMGEATTFENVVIPAVVFTDPEVAWCGLTENEAKQKEIPVEVVRFPWAALGRAVTMDRTDGVTKLIVDPDTERILGVGIAGPNAGELISEGVLAVEMGATVKDLALSVHPHPTLSETMMEVAEAFYGHSTHIQSRKKSA